MDEITRQQSQQLNVPYMAIPPMQRRWSSAAQLASPFSRPPTPVPTPRTYIAMSDDIDAQIPPMMASPTLSYRPRTMDDTHSSTPQTTPTHKRVQFAARTTLLNDVSS
jgi:hypothetical protein